MDVSQIVPGCFTVVLNAMDANKITTIAQDWGLDESVVVQQLIMARMDEAILGVREVHNNDAGDKNEH